MLLKPKQRNEIGRGLLISGMLELKSQSQSSARLSLLVFRRAFRNVTSRDSNPRIIRLVCAIANLTFASSPSVVLFFFVDLPDAAGAVLFQLDTYNTQPRLSYFVHYGV